MAKPEEEGRKDQDGQSGKIFSPCDLSQQPPIFSLPDELWTSMLSTSCAFEPQFFQRVMLNLINHPDIASTYLFRAEIFYDSFNDPEGKFVKHVKAEYRPRSCKVPEGYEMQQTIVRRLVPRNPQRDEPLVQTCHIFKSGAQGAGEERNLVIYLPHVESAEDVPFYHPTVSALSFLHVWPAAATATNDAPTGTLSIHYRLFPPQPLTARLTRTALSLLTLINKHSLGQKAGYTKRVHHDQLIPQARFQDTYTRLKATYAKKLIQAWVEQTPPGKHVFEDLGIAAFLLELWGEMYSTRKGDGQGEENGGEGKDDTVKSKPPFPGFVDIGCGNGVLVYVLLQEGYAGWGFDARKRKTWETFPTDVQRHLKELVLVPEIFTQSVRSPAHTPNADAAVPANLDLDGSEPTPGKPGGVHNGIFPPGTFIVSNHADELTPWTPLLAFLAHSPFIAIPCCSHNLAGAKFRAPPQKDAADETATGKPARQRADGDPSAETGGKTGSLKRPNNKQPSAYATLCDWVARLASDVGFVPEKEMLRIPSTRNAGVVGRRRKKLRVVGRGVALAGNGAVGSDSNSSDGSANGVIGAGEAEGRHVDAEELDMDQKLDVVRRLLVKEMGGNVDGLGGMEEVGREWVERARKLVKGQGGGH